MRRQSTLCGGLVRLLAEHYVIKYQVGVLIWSKVAIPHDKASDIMRKDYQGLGTTIDALGQRMTELSCDFPAYLDDIAKLSSLEPIPYAITDTGYVESLKENHEQIFKSIDFLSTILSLDSFEPDHAFLSGIAVQRRASIVALDSLMQQPT